jgi:hypothetical protein
MRMMWKRSSDGEAENRETLAAAAWMMELASLPVSEEPLPDPTYLWWKGELLRRWDAQQKATELIEVGEQVQVGLSLVAAAGLLVWLWRTLPGIATSSRAGTSLTLGLIFSAVLLAATAAVTVRDWIRGS